MPRLSKRCWRVPVFNRIKFSEVIMGQVLTAGVGPEPLLDEMFRRDAKKGLASPCIGGRMGVALAIER